MILSTTREELIKVEVLDAGAAAADYIVKPSGVGEFACLDPCAASSRMDAKARKAQRATGTNRSWRLYDRPNSRTKSR
jgi:DNA-binding response OmpR family regulator